MQAFEALIGVWHGEGELPIDPPLKLFVETKIERLGEFVVLSSVGEPAESASSVPARRRARRKRLA